MAFSEQERAQLLAEAIPKAFDHATRHQSIILQSGRPLSPRERTIAVKVGVQHPDRVRILAVPRIPPFDSPRLAEIAVLLNYPTEVAGTAVGYGIYLREDQARNEDTLAHELVHVAQHERFGGLLPYITKYCKEVARFGYNGAPMEAEARKLAAAWSAQRLGVPPGARSIVPAFSSLLLIAVGLYVIYSLVLKDGMKS